MVTTLPLLLICLQDSFYYFVVAQKWAKLKEKWKVWVFFGPPLLIRFMMRKFHLCCNLELRFGVGTPHRTKLQLVELISWRDDKFPDDATTSSVYFERLLHGEVKALRSCKNARILFFCYIQIANLNLHVYLHHRGTKRVLMRES